MVETKRTTINIPKDMLKAVKSIAIEKETTQTNIILDFIDKGLKATGKEHKFINDRLPKPKNVTKKYDSLKDMEGICEIEDPENTDINEVIDNALHKMDLYK